MKLAEKIINLGFSILLTFYLLMFLTNKLKTITDIIFGIMAIGISCSLLFSKNIDYNTISHTLFAIYVMCISLFSNNIKVLILNTIILIFTVATRIFFKRCILYLKHSVRKYKKKYKNDGFIKKLKYLSEKFLGFNIPFGAYEILLLVTIYRLYRLSN